MANDIGDRCCWRARPLKGMNFHVYWTMESPRTTTRTKNVHGTTTSRPSNKTVPTEGTTGAYYFKFETEDLDLLGCITMRLTPLQCSNYARKMLHMPTKETMLCTDSEKRMFRATLGVSFPVMSELWNRLDPTNNISNRAKPEHLLWTLVFLKVNNSEPVHLQITGCRSRDTFRRWVNRFATAITTLETEIINLGNRFQGWDGKTRCLMCVDGTDVPIYEPGDRSSIWWSHKFNGPGIRYEVATCIRTGDIVWFRGPFPCNMSDKAIFDLYLSTYLFPGEGVEADSGYTGRAQIFTPGVAKDRKTLKQKSQVRGRHENVNGRLKIFGVMKRWNNPDTAKHAVFAKCVAIIVQLSFSLGENLYAVNYEANYD